MKRTISVILAAVLLFAALSGCGGGGSGSGGGATTAQATAAATTTTTAKATEAATTTTAAATTTTEAAKADAGGASGADPVEWTWMVVEFVNAPVLDDSLANKFYEEKFNIKIHYDVVNSADYDTKVNLVMASDDLPDLLYAWDLSKYYNTGKLTDLTPYLEKNAPDFLNEIKKDPTVVRNCKDDKGRNFFFPTLMWNYEHVMHVIHTGYLDQLGLSIPTTTDEFRDAMLAMKTLDPKIIPMTSGQWAPGSSLHNPFYYAFGTWNGWFPFSDTEYLYGPYERREEMRECLKYLNGLYTEKAIDQDYLSIDQDTYVAKFTNGEVGSVFGWVGGDWMWARTADGGWEDHYDWQIIPALKGPKGHQMTDTTDVVNVKAYIPVSNPDPERACEFFNWRYTQEGKDFLVYGIEGETFTKEPDGSIKYTEMVETHELGVMNGLRKMGFWPVFMPYVNVPEAYALFAPPPCMDGLIASAPYMRPSSPVLTLTDEELDNDAQIGADIEKYVGDTLPKFVVGQLNTDSDFDAFISQLEKMKVSDYIANRLGAYERWKSR